MMTNLTRSPRAVTLDWQHSNKSNMNYKPSKRDYTVQVFGLWSDWDWARFNVHQTHYRSYRGRFLQVIWPNQQCQSNEGNQLVFQI